MGFYDIDAATTTNLNNLFKDYSSPLKDTDIISWTPQWDKWHGIYRDIPENQATIDVWCRWIVGKKIKFLDNKSEDIAKKIRGNGKDTFRKILINAKRTSKICGDSFTEIARDKAGRLINLIPRNPGTITIIGNQKSRILKYVQFLDNTNVGNAQAAVAAEMISSLMEAPITSSWDPNQIFAISNNRIADEIHGIPESEKLEKIGQWKKQASEDQSIIIRRYGKPTYFYEADTEDDTELDALTTKINKTITKFENMVVPKGTLQQIQNVRTPQFGTIDVIPWLSHLRSYYTEASGVPDLIRGKSDEVSLAAGKLNVLGFKEKVIMEQLEYAEEIEDQLGIRLEFEAPPEIDIEIARLQGEAEDMVTAKQDKKQTSGREVGEGQN